MAQEFHNARLSHPRGLTELVVGARDPLGNAYSSFRTVEWCKEVVVGIGRVQSGLQGKNRAHARGLTCKAGLSMQQFGQAERVAALTTCLRYLQPKVSINQPVTG